MIPKRINSDVQDPEINLEAVFSDSNLPSSTLCPGEWNVPPTYDEYSKDGWLITTKA